MGEGGVAEYDLWVVCLVVSFCGLCDFVFSGDLDAPCCCYSDDERISRFDDVASEINKCNIAVAVLHSINYLILIVSYVIFIIYKIC